MTNILFVIGSFRAGGMERRALSLIKYISKSNLFNVECIVLNPKIHYREILSLKIKLHIIDRDIKTRISVLKEIFYIKKNFNPKIIHAWDTISTLYILPFTFFDKSKLITSKISDAPTNYKRFSAFGFLSEICFKFSDIILSNSKSGLIAYGLTNNKKSFYIHNGFDFTRIKNLTNPSEVKKNLGIKKKFVVSMVASFSDTKDYNSFLEVASEILKKKSDVVFLCIGDGHLKDELKKTYNHNSIKFLGNRNDVESLINMSDIGVLMSKYGEGISNAIMEFMALGKPIVASDNPGNRELVVSNMTGFLIKNNLHDDLLDNIIMLIGDKNLRNKLGKQAKKRISNKFSLKIMTDNFLDLYNRLL